MTLQLPSDLEKFIEERVQAGEYASAQEVVRAGLLLLKVRREQEGDDLTRDEFAQLVAEVDFNDSMSLDEVLEKRRAERATRKGAL